MFMGTHINVTKCIYSIEDHPEDYGDIVLRRLLKNYGHCGMKLTTYLQGPLSTTFPDNDSRVKSSLSWATLTSIQQSSV